MQSTLAVLAAVLFAGGTLLEAQFATAAAPASAGPMATAPASPPTGTGAEERRLFAQAVRQCRSGEWHMAAGHDGASVPALHP